MDVGAPEVGLTGMGIWVVELFERSAVSPAVTLELGDFSRALEAVCGIESADKGQFVRLRPPTDATPDQLRSLMRAGALILLR
jgi:hypothetical protein